jgi:hypothetical protein
MHQLQEIFALTGNTLDLPRIVVIGSQSAGKSSGASVCSCSSIVV